MIKAVSVRNICKTINGKKILDDINFDVYEGEQVGEGQKSVAYSLMFRANDRTLTDEDIDKAMKLFEEGISLVNQCSLKLDETKKKIEILVNKDGKCEREIFKGKNETNEDN